jgi:transketolase
VSAPSVPAAAVRRELARWRAERPELAVLESAAFDPSGPPAASERFEEPLGPAGPLENGLSEEGWLLCSVDEALGRFWPAIRAAVAAGAAGPKVVATYDLSASTAPLADLGAFAALPRMMVGAPADAASAAAAVGAARRAEAPVYLRLPAGAVPPLSDGSFDFAAAPQLRAGEDLTVLAVGPALGPARAVADRLASIGIATRLLDGASVKPLDAPSCLRAARETGALLTVEEHTVLGGFGTMVAALVAAEHPVRVRRVGLPDLPAGAPRESGAAGYGVEAERLAEEAWTLLRARGKVQ